MRKLLLLFVSVLLLADIIYSFLQHQSKPLDGDLPGGIVPSHDVRPVLSDPLGFTAIQNDSVYPNPNRYFSHASFYLYFDTVPFLLQNFLSPITSLYVSAALFKILVQLILILQLSLLFSKNKFKVYTVLPVALIISVFFQTNGFQSEIGIIDQSVSYVFFYAFPMIFLLHYFSPLFRFFLYDEELKLTFRGFIFRSLLAFPVCLSSPLQPGIVLIIFLLTVLWLFSVWGIRFYDRQTNLKIMLYFVPVVLLSVYSLYLGNYNSIAINNQKAISELYVHLASGIYILFTLNISFQLLFYGIILQLFIFLFSGLFREDSSMRWIYLFTYLFCLIYILLLPLGGYRGYRPEIIRYDTFLPVTLVLIFLFTYGSIQIFMNFQNKKWFIISPFVFICLVFAIKDKPGFYQNEAEKAMLIRISADSHQTVLLPYPVQVISWQPLMDESSSVLIGKMLFKYHITDKPKVFFCNSK